NVTFEIADSDLSFEAFTTRPDTIYGATYAVLAPENKLVDKITTDAQLKEVKDYQEQAQHKSELERTELTKEKSGVFTGAYAINPLSGNKLPIWISDYVIASYGTGAIMAVPAHHQHDYEVARKFEVEIIPLLEGVNIETEGRTGGGLHINSGPLNRLNVKDGIQKAFELLEQKNTGEAKITYR